MKKMTTKLLLLAMGFTCLSHNSIGQSAPGNTPTTEKKNYMQSLWKSFL